MKWKGGDAYGKVPERILAVPPLKVGGARGVMKLTHGFAEGKRERCLARAEISM